jgi:putative serine protease PepD
VVLRVGTRTMLEPVPSIGRTLRALIPAAILLSACSSTHAATAPTGTTSPSTSSPPGAAALQDDFVKTIGMVRPSVVEVATDSGLGSGVVYDTKGDIVTNAHVVGTATRFRVALLDGQVVDAALVGTYAAGDLAVVKVAAGVRVAPLPLADSGNVRVGDISIAVGNPLGLSSSVTEGIVSSVGRTVGEGNGVVLPSSIQTSAPINPGNSGGALVDIDGALIGVPTLAAINPEMGSAAVGIGFAIPSNTVKLIADQLIADGRVTKTGRASLGVVGSDAVDPSTGSAVAVLVRDVQAGSAAARAGIRVGDLITAVDGRPTPDLNSLSEILAGHQPGDNVRLDVRHEDGTTQSFTLTLDELTG